MFSCFGFFLGFIFPDFPYLFGLSGNFTSYCFYLNLFYLNPFPYFSSSTKYTILSLDKHNIRPYVVAGLGTYVGLSSQKLFDFDAAKYVSNPVLSSLLNALLNGAQVGGLAPIAPELRGRGLSAGQGDFRFGLNAGGGMEVRVSPRFSIGFDYRINKIEGKNGTFSTFSAKPTIHF